MDTKIFGSPITREGEETIIACGQAGAPPQPWILGSSPLLAALRDAGTARVYADTADGDELREVATTREGHLVEEIDGTTINQPLVRRVLGRYIEGERVLHSLPDLRSHVPGLPDDILVPVLYTIVCGWIGNDLVASFGAGHRFEVSLQLHMATAGHPEAAKQLGRWLHRMIPSVFVKVPFTPQAPDCFLIARDLEREGIAVNFTSTFSARQAVAAALLGNVARTNVFMGRLNQGLGAELLGEHVVLEAQRAIGRLRRDAGIKTLLIVASMRDWQSFPRLAGCDVFTAPCAVLRAFLDQATVLPEMLESQLETDYQERLTVGASAMQALGSEQVARLWRVERELVEFLREYRATDEYRRLEDGDQLRRRFETAGFGGMFYAPTIVEWEALRRSKLPDLASPLSADLDLDTLYSLLADADFAKEQDAIDAELARRAHGRAAAA